MKVPKISVLVPSFNVEKSLRLCLESILNQSFTDFEVIILNDGSTDNTLKIAKEFEKRDKRIKVSSSKKNLGYGTAMNRGLSLAKGSYIAIVEPDDFIHKNFLSTLYGLAKHYKVDIVKCSYMNNYMKTGKAVEEVLFHKNHEHIETDTIINPIENKNVFLTQPTIWSAIYNRKMLEKNSIKFLETPGASYQDVGFQFKAFTSSKSVYCTNLPLYYYCRDNENSSVKSTKKVEAVIKEYNELENFITKRPELKQVLSICRVRSYMWNANRLKFKTAYKFAKKAGKIKLDTTGFDLNSAHELKFFSRHPRIYVVIRPLFWFKNWAMRTAYKIVNVIMVKRSVK